MFLSAQGNGAMLSSDVNNPKGNSKIFLSDLSGYHAFDTFVRVNTQWLLHKIKDPEKTLDSSKPTENKNLFGRKYYIFSKEEYLYISWKLV